MDIFQRTKLLIGDAGLAKLNASRVAVIGLGGVGSHAAEALARAGIGSFLLIDFDVVNPTNLNRQLIALQSSIGIPKTELMKTRINSINPAARVQIKNEFCSQENRENLIPPVDFLLDAIDSLGPKIGLLEYCLKKAIPLISVMGAGNRLDPAQIQIADISKTHACPLAKRVRKFLRRRGIKSGFPCVFSTETPLIPEDEEDIPDEIIIHRGRERKTIGSISYMPAIMGYRAAAYIINQLLSNSN